MSPAWPLFEFPVYGTQAYMGHYINGFIARFDLLVAAAQALPNARVCRLRCGFGFLPLTEEVASSGSPALEYESLDQLTAEMTTWAQEQSRHFPIAYIQTEYHGGTGSQGAIAWRHGVVSCGPVETNNEYGPVTSFPEGAINCAVRTLGVERGDAHDEFEALGLNRYRSNDDWVAATGE